MKRVFLFTLVLVFFLSYTTSAEAGGMVKLMYNILNTIYYKKIKTYNRVNVDVVDIINGETIKIRYHNVEFNVKLQGVDCFEAQYHLNGLKDLNTSENTIMSLIIRDVAEKKSKKILSQLINQNKDNIYLTTKGKNENNEILGILHIGNNNQSINDYILAEGLCKKTNP